MRALKFKRDITDRFINLTILNQNWSPNKNDYPEIQHFAHMYAHKAGI